MSSRSQIQNLFPLLPHVYYAERQTRFFPSGYIAGLAGFLDGRSATLKLVREFNSLSQAVELYQKAVVDLATAIEAKEEYTPTEVAELFSVGRATVSGWIQAKKLPFEEKKLQHGQIVPMGPRQQRVMGRQFITATTLRQLFEWATPF